VPRQRVEINQQALTSCLEMGFEEERSRRVLLHFRNNMERAIDHMMNAPDDLRIVDPNEGLEERRNSESEPMEEEERQGESPQQEIRPAHRNPFAPADFQPNPEALQMLIDMGFVREDCIYALEISNNN